MDSRDNRNRDTSRHLYRLGELSDYKVASDDPDVRDWALLDRDNEKLGTINELIVDPDQEKVRYLDVIPTKGIREREDEHLLIPVGIARVNDDKHSVRVDMLDKDAFVTYPAYQGDAITRDYETTLVDRINGIGGGSYPRTPSTAFYDNDLFNEDRFYTTRNRGV